MLKLYVRYGFLSYIFVMVSLKMANKRRNILGQPN